MSDDDTEQYRVLYMDGDGHEQVTEAMTLDQANSRARDLEKQGCAVGSITDDASALAYMQDRYAPTYRGVQVPDGLRADGAPRSVYEAWKRGVDAELDKATPAGANPFAPDLAMSPEVAGFVLRAVNGLLLEGYWPKGYDADSRYSGTDDEDYDDALVRRAVDIVGRGSIKSTALLRFIAKLDAETGADR